MSYEGTFDVVVEGAGATRGARVVAAPDGLYVDDHEIPYGTLLGVALRSSILLVMGTQIAIALRGDREGLAALAAELRRHADISHLADPDRQALEDERVVFSTPVALSGVVDSERLKGLSLAIVTDSALHVLERGGRRTRVSWEELDRIELKEARFGRAIQLTNPEVDLELLYLTDAQIQTVRGLAGRHGTASGSATPGSTGPFGAAAGGPARARPPKGKARDRPAADEEGAEEARPPGRAGEPGQEEKPGERVEGLQSDLGPLIDALDTGSDPQRAAPEPPGPPRAPAESEEAERPERRERPEGPESFELLEPQEAPEPRESPESTRSAESPEPPPLPDIDDPQRHFRIPEFERSLGSVGTGSDRPLAAAIDRLQMSPVLPVGFLEEHLRELRTVYNGALVKRKREAAAASELTHATRALEGRELWSDLHDRVEVTTEAMLRAWERQARRLAANRRIPWRRARRKHMPRGKEVNALRQRLMRGIAPLERVLGRLSEAAQEVRVATDRGRGDLKEAYADWLDRLREMDEAYAAGWAGLGREVVGIWEDSLLPRLNALASQRRRWLPWPLRAAVYFALFIGVLVVAYLLLTGQGA